MVDSEKVEGSSLLNVPFPGSLVTPPAAYSVTYPITEILVVFTSLPGMYRPQSRPRTLCPKQRCLRVQIHRLLRRELEMHYWWRIANGGEPMAGDDGPGGRFLPPQSPPFIQGVRSKPRAEPFSHLRHL